MDTEIPADLLFAIARPAKWIAACPKCRAAHDVEAAEIAGRPGQWELAPNSRLLRCDGCTTVFEVFLPEISP